MISGATWATGAAQGAPFQCIAISNPDSGRQRLAFGLFAKGEEQQSDYERQSCQGNGCAQSLEMSHAGAHQQSESRGGEATEIRGESERAGAALGSVLLGKPERIDDEIGASQSHQERKNNEPSDGMHLHIEDVAEGD